MKHCPLPVLGHHPFFGLTLSAIESKMLNSSWNTQGAEQIRYTPSGANKKRESLNFQSNQLSCSLSFSPRDQVGNWEEDQKSRRTIYYNNQVCSQSWPIFLFLFCFSCLHVYLAISNKNFKERKHELEYGRQVKSRVEHSKSGRIAHTRQTREEWKRLLSLSSRNEAVTLCWLEQIFVDQS